MSRAAYRPSAFGVRREILEAVTHPMTAEQIANVLQAPCTTVRSRLAEMRTEGLMQIVGSKQSVYPHKARRPMWLWDKAS